MKIINPCIVLISAVQMKKAALTISKKEEQEFQKNKWYHFR
jgi:hypothetical protein